MRQIGLRVDVDTYAGTRDGVPRLLDLFARRGIRASFFFTLGPDNMGRHLWRLLRPAFFWKMLRTGAPSLYGREIIFAGTAWPGRRIAPALGEIMRETLAQGHEVGLHAWDHQAWQARLPGWSAGETARQVRLGLEALEEVLGRKALCSAAPGWRADARVIEVKEGFAFRYNSDCRGTRPFRPLLADGRYGTPQIPVSLPTFDEVIGGTVGEEGFNAYILDAARLCPGTPVYAIHAEVEGRTKARLFAGLVNAAFERGFEFRPLGDLLPEDVESLPAGRVEWRPFPGREGCLGVQVETGDGE
ncbi:MAG: 4-deoxy-4-formamido-L-arabinose-phosphoundecaprenol deformylase [Desulfovibrio sp.]|jgi:undecaprenyl phosphate-alpha-L-ara4FN deformylase|nr:4-deoxy-4-formamido-L-arabinose-phosphoundecaprenol deformylase [Desulfovibrio sp.]